MRQDGFLMGATPLKCDRFVGKSKHMHFDFSVEIYDPDGGCETVVEITAPLPSEAEALFRRTVDKLADTIANIPCLSVTESLVLDVTSNIDSVTFPEVSMDTNDSVTFKDNPVTESLVSDATNDSVTFKDNPVTESLVSDATKDSVTAINIYEAKGTARGNRKYFRYSYKEVGKVKHLHIGGGNIHSLVAQSRMQLVKDALARGQSPNEIKQLIRQLRN
jgi:hypothetical protein